MGVNGRKARMLTTSHDKGAVIVVPSLVRMMGVIV
jgi:hypothetical protein